MTPSSKEIFNRAELLLGADAMERLAAARVILFGVGGVGSWCAEGLIRSGIGHLTLVDADCVAPSNINRQRMATVRYRRSFQGRCAPQTVAVHQS
jgi:Dinucleotide-utilizing enzymes involved in molybdopterin and thiamine biosynthesis family 1